ncbi:MAG: putative DNA binding domain-containing protein [Acidobacteria bacterium]|nr:putative DNA binding domain-containing protein [Acidobacteriota bacterium]MBI3489951.1 putative DNA binding domain-containing protein [Acidobacteriota bacterium]
MRSAEHLLQELNSSDECAGIEAKRGREIGKSILETISAFSNEPDLGGGYLLLGVTWEVNLFGDRVYRPDGLSDPDKVQADLASQCASVFNQIVRPEMNLERIDDKTVLVVYIPEVATSVKPVFLKSVSLPRGAWRRIGSTDQRCAEEDIWALRGKDAPTESYDAAVIRDSSWDDFDPAAISEYRRLRTLVNANAEELSYSDQDLMESLCAIRSLDGQIKATLAGILLFGKSAALRRLLPATRVDYLRVIGTEWIDDPERRFQSLDIRKALLLTLRQAEAAIIDDLPKGFHLPEGSLQSVQEPVLPRKVIRETLANALMHRNYRINEPIQIIRFSNRIEVHNPGYSLKRPDELGQPGSRQRNPLIAATFHDLNLAETKGTGIRTVRRLLEEAGMASPEFQSDREHERFKAIVHLHHLFSLEDLEWLKALNSESLSADASKVLLFIREAEAVDNMTCRNLTGLDTLQSSALLRRLRDQGFLIKEGSGSRTYYTPSSKLTNGIQSVPSREVPRPLADPHQFLPDSHQFPLDPHQAAADPHQFIPTVLLQRLPASGAKPRQEIIRALVLDLCSLRPFSARELAKLLGDRDPKELVRSHLAPLLESGQLVYTMKDMPNHPGQQYVVPTRGTGSP